MSKARNLADVISGAYDVPAEALDNAPAPTLSTLGIANHDQITVDSSGRITSGTTPAFMAASTTRDGSNYYTNYTTGGTTYSYMLRTDVQNVGNHFNTTTGIFTAPITGTYCLFVAITSANSSTTREIVELHINNTYRGEACENSGFYSDRFGSFITNLSTNDTVRLKADGGNIPTQVYLGGFLLP